MTDNLLASVAETIHFPHDRKTTNRHRTWVLPAFCHVHTVVVPASRIWPLHNLTYRLLGIHLQMTLNTASPDDQSLRRPVAELAGPVVNLIIAMGAAFAYQKLWQRKSSLAALSLASAMFRLAAVYVLVLGVALFTGSGLSMGNDEPIAARLWRVPSLTFLCIFAIPFLLVVWSIARTFRANRFRTLLHILGLGLITLCLGILVGHFVDPWLFPSRYNFQICPSCSWL